MRKNSIFMNTIITNTITYLKFTLRELVAYRTYLNAFFIGASINLLSGNGFPGAWAPYIVPVIVQAFSRSAVMFKNRYKDKLLQLPSEREDPAFIINQKGKIILSTGITFKTFQTYGIENITQLIGNDGFTNISYCFTDKTSNNMQTEVYSNVLNKWYEARIKPINSQSSKNEKEYLIWFTDITARIDHETRLSNMLKFSNDILSSLPKIIEKSDVYELLAEFFLTNDYKGVFFTRMDKDGNLQGNIFKHNDDNKMEKSELITISAGSSAPILYSRKKSKIVSGDISSYPSRKKFETEYPFDERVKAFFSFPINNFINYHEVDVSIIAFNKMGIITKYDNIFMEIIVNIAKTIIQLAEGIQK